MKVCKEWTFQHVSHYVNRNILKKPATATQARMQTQYSTAHKAQHMHSSCLSLLKWLAAYADVALNSQLLSEEVTDSITLSDCLYLEL